MKIEEIEKLEYSIANRDKLRKLAETKVISWFDALRILGIWRKGLFKKVEEKKEFIKVFGKNDPEIITQAEKLFG